MLTAKDFLVSQKDKEDILQDYFEEKLDLVSPNENPQVFFIGGQPAAGKSQLIERIQEDFDGAFVIDSDELRQRHPQINEIINHDPLRMDVLSNEPVGYWFKTCIDEAKKRRCNIIIENSFTQSQVLIDEAHRFLNDNYHVSFFAIATPEEISRLGIIGRYKNAVEQNRLPRWTTSASHDNAYNKMSGVITEILNSPITDTVHITSRDQTLTHRITNPNEVETTVTHIRHQTLTNHPLDTWAQTYAECITFMHDHNLITNYTQPLLTQLHHDAEKLLPTTQLPHEHTQLANTLHTINNPYPLNTSLLENPHHITQPATQNENTITHENHNNPTQELTTPTTDMEL
ncbi:Zeta toxin (plasmid) [Corynebacterium mustelae]|uniref:UDP-N-acetylglucosamine kinase n=1 Tax=Corynebacterium mustelae TaxID=571915 RepID=A0A0G3H1X6_9CORY|nr:zeta toxin family protein [Corynebacterium mustelae]AKK07416.1 Zeta toxin [Corynebacterium mustelae]